MINFFSIDFESWVYPDLPFFKQLTDFERRKLDNGYVRDSIGPILKKLRLNKTKITFFVVSQLYDWYPDIIDQMAAEGHEIAYHTHSHNILTTKKKLIDSLEKSRKFLKKYKPKGFRAPVFSMKKEYFPILYDYGFRYDSSVYGPFENRQVHCGVTEIPVSNFSFLPIGSGICLALMKKRIEIFYRRLNRLGIPFVAFLHNWQIVKPENASFPNWEYLLKNPLYLPYTFEISSVFDFLLKNYKLAPMNKLGGEKL